MRAAAHELYDDPTDADRIFTPDTRELMAFFVTMRKLLLECGIKDFTFSDLYRPTRPRLVKIFSYIINFIRFRESQTSVIDEYYNSSEKTKSRVEELWAENQEKEEHLQEMQRNRQNVEAALKEKETRKQELTMRLLELKKTQDRVAEKLERVREEQSRLKALLQDRTTNVLNTRAEAAKLRPYTEQSPAVLEGAVRDLNAKAAADRAEIERLDRRARALQTSTDSFTLLTSQITSLTHLLTAISTDLQKEEEEHRTALKNREALAEKSNEVREVERQEKILRKQLEMWTGRTEKLRQEVERKGKEAREKMEGLRGVHGELSRERRGVGEEVERRKVRIEMVEKKVRIAPDPGWLGAYTLT